MSKRVALYLRVSTSDQTSENQDRILQDEAAARDWQIVDTFRDDGISGAKGRDKRPALDKMLRQIGRYDMVAVFALDRLGRSTADLLNIVDTLNGAGVNLYVHNMHGMPVDTTTPIGKMVFTVISAIAEMERGVMRERITAGINRAKAQGKRFGRPKLDSALETRAVAYLTEGRGILAVASLLGIGSSTVQRIKREMTASA
jgi:DNA invertase Pin-like site-specific DNA recombinase